MPPVFTGPYDTAEYVLNLARSIANDAALGIQGNLLSDNQPYTFPMLNAAYRDLQDELTDAGFETFPAEAELTQVPAISVNPQPGLQVSIDYNGYNNGTQNFDSPYLPIDMVGPLRLWERQSGANAQYIPMGPANDGLPSVAQGYRFGVWEWRQDKIWMVGATQINDLRLRYNSILPDLVDGDSPVLVLRSDRALAYALVAEWAGARGSPMAAALVAKANECIGKMTNRTARKKQRGSHRRMPYGSSQGFSWGVGGSSS